MYLFWYWSHTDKLDILLNSGLEEIGCKSSQFFYAFVVRITIQLPILKWTVLLKQMPASVQYSNLPKNKLLTFCKYLLWLFCFHYLVKYFNRIIFSFRTHVGHSVSSVQGYFETTCSSSPKDNIRNCLIPCDALS